MPDGVHPGPDGMRKIADAWFQALQTSGYFKTRSNTAP